MDTDLEFDDTFADETEVVEEEPEPPRQRSPLRIILLLLIIFVLLCVVCYAASGLLGGISNILPAQLQSVLPGVGDETPTPVPVVETETAGPVVTEELPPEATTEPAPTEELLPPGTVEVPATGEPVPTEEPVEPAPTTEPEPEAGPPVVVTPISCDENQPPVAKANGPYTGMMGKGQARVTFDATDSNDPDGKIIKYEWEFGDDSAPGEGEIVTHGYTEVGNYVAILTVTDNCNAIGQDTAEVMIVGPTPPSPNETPDPEPTTEPPSGDVTLGFCYLVQYGDTLSGIAWYYGISIQELAMVNGVSSDYFVIAGQGLFIPADEGAVSFCLACLD